MEIIYFKELKSTQNYLKENLKPNICIWTDNQTDGVGSRANKWIGEKGNLFFSFSLDKDAISNNVPIQSISIYYMYQLKIVLNELGSRVKFKWPNDLYIKYKVGGIISNIKDDIIIIGIGLNTKRSENFEALDIKISNKDILERYFNLVDKKLEWDFIFEQYKKEFYKNRFITNNIDLSKAKLNEDGSIQIDNERIYSLR